MAINKFNDILERTKRHNEERKADRELKKKGIDKMKNYMNTLKIILKNNLY